VRDNLTEQASDTAVRYAIEPRTSRFTVRVSASGVLSALGHNPTIAIRSFSGELRFNPENSSEDSLRIVAQASSLAVMDDISDKDRREIESQMQEEVLESSRYPEIVYDCSRVSANRKSEGQYEVILDGNLTLHGVTRAQSISAKVAVTGESVRTFGEFSARQSDYGIRLVSALGGALKVKDEVKFVFDIVARKQG